MFAPPHHDTLMNTIAWFKSARPEPTSKDLHSQLGCHFEEVREMINEISSENPTTTELLMEAEDAVKALAEHLKASDNVIFIGQKQREAFLDALCDQIVTAVGCAHVADVQVGPAMDDVNISNFSKFDDEGKPIYDANKKVTKGPNYVKADLSPYI